MKIAVVGSGISGIVAARQLHKRHDVTVFEANDYVGGHTHTVDVSLGGRDYAVDTGFIVFNDRTYPNFQQLLDDCGVPYQPTSMSFAVRNDVNGWEYCGSNLRGLFCQKRNLIRPAFYRMLRDILRFNRQAPDARDAGDQTVAEFLARHRYSREFADNYLLAMGAAIWSCPQQRFSDFPMRFVARFFENHGLLSLRNRPQWYVIEGGSKSYIPAFTAGFRDRIRLNAPVRHVRRMDDGVELIHSDGVREQFDHVVFACHSDQALRMLADADETERIILSCFPYEKNIALLHTDTSVLPRRRQAWASWNYHFRADRPERSTVTYNMNILQGIEAPQTFCVTLNEEDSIDPARVLGRFEYAHPLFTVARDAAQARHHELINRRRTSYCGAYWGNGFHEDGVNSALAVSRVLADIEEPCAVASTTV